MSEKMFRCPICSANMALRNINSLVCSNRHCFDLSKHGYVNFLSNQSKTKYTKELFDSRRCIFQSGFYTPLKENIECLINEYLGTAPSIRLLDAGCGEGFFIPTPPAVNNQTMEVFALDIHKDAIISAARKNNAVNRIVGDLSNIPLKSNSISLVLNVFAPANYSEFMRVMQDNGFIIKVIPNDRYLAELRGCAEGQLINKEYSNKRVLDYFHKNMACLDSVRLSYQLPVTEYQVENFIRMTPLMFSVDKAKISLEGIKQITIDVEIIIGKKPRQ